MDYKKIMRWARRASDSEVRALYFEVFGATFSGLVTVERARASLEEACKELLERGKVQDSTQYNRTGDEIMAKDTDKMLEEMRAGFKATTEKLLEIDATLNVILRKLMGEAPKSGEKFVPVSTPDGEKKLAEVPSMDELREVATAFSKAFGMNDLVALFKKLGAARGRLSEIVDENKPLLLTEMKGRLEKENGTAAAGALDLPPVTLDQVKERAKAFMDKNGKEPFAALLKTFGAAKLSEVPAEKLGALAEALSNA
jgi:hypothetical protein